MTTIVLSMIIACGVGVLLRESFIQASLSRNLIQQIAIYSECNSLVPIVKKTLSETKPEELNQPDPHFLEIKGISGPRWEIGRSELKHQKIRLEFRLVDQSIEFDPIRFNLAIQNE